MRNPLASRIALVTGASRGVGHATARALARAGAHIVAVARTVGGLEELDDEIRKDGGSATLVPLNMTDSDGIARLGAALNERRALDRTLGFLFGLARGLLIIVVAFLFFAWLVPEKQQPDWVRSAKSRVVLQGTGDWLMSLLPDDPENTILKRFKKPKTDDDQQTDAAPDPKADSKSAGAADGGYAKSARDGLKQLIDGKAAGR